MERVAPQRTGISAMVHSAGMLLTMSRSIFIRSLLTLTIVQTMYLPGAGDTAEIIILLKFLHGLTEC